MVTAHWRLLLGIATAVLAWAAARLLGAPENMPLLIGWNLGALVYLGLAWRVFLTSTEAQLRARAARQDEKRGVILILALVAILAALGGIVDALLAVKGGSPTEKGEIAVLTAITLITSWTFLQTVFVAHYAHRHFQSLGVEGDAFIFPGKAPASYMDFVYLSFCIGATAQVSDPGVGVTRLRNLVTVHSVISFFYNTAILAVGINILAGLLGN